MAAGFHPHLAGAWHRYGAKALGASMWFWMMYRAKQDMPVLLVCITMMPVKTFNVKSYSQLYFQGWRHPWDGHGHGDEHAEHH
ncbi:hypothetical protein INT43_007073 [Umbelopsis isabellina]|uniref:Uncharacterized protein n=1 Tax=Mortierella isabellina TaxID=91625 RepID=A0A8H7PZU2_MORIS|nr:hypothetical protein INT43_007073 [Umbelopsis isabellina]